MDSPSKMSALRDAQSVFSGIKNVEKQIQHKKRWLLGNIASKTERKHFKEKVLDDGFLSESLYRDEDVFYEFARAYTGSLFGVCHTEGEFDVVLDDMLSNDIPSIKRLISCLDNMTTRGLNLLAEIITGGTVKFERTRGELLMIVKSFLSRAIRNQNLGCRERKIFEQLFELIKNCKAMSASRSQSNHVAVKKVLGDLKCFSCQTLKAMRRKLNREEATIPTLRTGRKNWKPKEFLINQVRKESMQMLSRLSDRDELQEPLAKAMAVADLSLKLGNHNHILSKTFYQAAPKVKSLQDDIMKAIWRVENGEVGIPVLRELGLLLEPKAEISSKSLKLVFKELLTEFLFECSDMDKIPESLSNIVDVINRSSGDMSPKLLQEEKIKEEVDHILNVSTQAKQIVLDLFLDYRFDEDFSHAYGEQLVESDEDECNAGTDSENIGANFYCEAVEPETRKNDMRKNQYLTIQGHCDETSILTHKLIGRLLWEIAKSEGLDLNGSKSLYLRGDTQIKDGKGLQSSPSKRDSRNSTFIQAVEDLAPSFSDRAMKRLKKLTG